MKFTASLLVICTYLYCANAHVSYSEWRLIDTVCKRPSTGACVKAGTCCGQRNSGTQRLERDCTHDVCPPDMLKKTRDCTIRCYEADANAYGAWKRAGNCERPATGRCAADGTCCGEREGTMKHTRECKAANGCDAPTLKRDFQCNVRCGFVNPCRLYPNPCENGGTCVEDGHSHSCNCAEGWTGHHCDEAVAPATCEPAITTLKKGTVKCSDSNNEGSTCELTCDRGYTCGEWEPHVHETTCTNGAWSETPVEECIPKECPISYLENLEKQEGMESVTCSGGIEGMRNTMNARCEFKCKDGYLPSRTDLSDGCRIRLDGEVKEGWWYYGNDPVQCVKTPADDPPAEATWTEFSPVGDCSATCGEGTQKYTRTCEGYDELGDCEGGSWMTQEKTETCNLGECEEEKPWCTEDDWIEATRIEAEVFSNYKIEGKTDTKEECQPKCLGHDKADHVVWVAAGQNTNLCLCFWTVVTIKGEWTTPPLPGQSNALICKKPAPADDPPAEEPELVCDVGFQQENSCYFRINQGMIYANAKTACEEQGAQLAHFSSPDTVKAVVEYLVGEGGGYHWTGGDGSYDGTSKSKTVTWLNGEQYTIEFWYSESYPKEAAVRTHFALVADQYKREREGFMNAAPTWGTPKPLCVKDAAESTDDNNDVVELIPGKTCWKEGEQFSGTTVSTTASGKTCDTWSHDFTAWHSYDDEGDYDKSMYDAASDDIEDDTAGNYCRNYKEDPNGPYCFVGATKVDYNFTFEEIYDNGNILSSQDHFEYCDIPKCP